MIPTLVASAILLLSQACGFAACDAKPPSVGVGAGGGAFTVEKTLYHADGTPEHVTYRAEGAAPETTYEYRYVPACGRNTPTEVDLCTGFAGACPTAGDLQWWMYYRVSGPPPLPASNPWLRIPRTYCLGPRPDIDLPAVKAGVERAFSRLVPPAGTLQVQPRGRTLIGVPTIFWTTAVPATTLRTRVLGVAVTIDAVADYVFDFGDGSEPLVTQSAGHPYPDEDVTHVYAVTGAVAPTVSLRWGGTYRVAGIATPFPITGTVTRTSPAVPVAVAEARSQLVAGDG